MAGQEKGDFLLFGPTGTAIKLTANPKKLNVPFFLSNLRTDFTPPIISPCLCVSALNSSSMSSVPLRGFLLNPRPACPKTPSS